MKESGLGCRHGREGILKFTEPQTIAAQRGMMLALPPGEAAATARARWLTWSMKLMRYLGM